MKNACPINSACQNGMRQISKGIVCSVLILMACMPAVAQNNNQDEAQSVLKTFLEDNPVWMYKFEDLAHIHVIVDGQAIDKWMTRQKAFTYYFLGGEKEIEGKTYRMMGRVESRDNNVLCASDWLPVREENGVVFTVTEQLPGIVGAYYDVYVEDEYIPIPYFQYGKESVLYNFNTISGDRLNPYDEGSSVKLIDSYVLMDGSRVRVLKCNDNQYDLYEPIGYMAKCGLTDPLCNLPSSIESQSKASILNAYYRDGQILYKAADPQNGLFEEGTAMTQEEVYTYVRSYRADPRHDEVMAYIQQLQKDNATSVPEVIADKSSPLYDLTGRLLTDAPKKGLYIKGGKKYVSQ